MKRETAIEGKYQMTIGEIIKKVKSGGYKDGKNPKEVRFDFGSAIPTVINSWRGSYDCPQIGYKLTGYDNGSEHFGKITAEQFVKELELGISGKEYTGWKGGEYCYNANQGLWVSNSGNASDTVIIDVINEGYYYLLVTTSCKY
jgi:hypothetical protein